jgi:hypothetical protein
MYSYSLVQMLHCHLQNVALAQKILYCHHPLHSSLDERHQIRQFFGASGDVLPPFASFDLPILPFSKAATINDN